MMSDGRTVLLENKVPLPPWPDTRSYAVGVAVVPSSWYNVSLSARTTLGLVRFRRAIERTFEESQ